MIADLTEINPDAPCRQYSMDNAEVINNVFGLRW
jgi:hypothetical protein